MPAAYSYDLRKNAMEALDAGESIADVAKRFKIDKTALYEWRKEVRKHEIFSQESLEA